MIFKKFEQDDILYNKIIVNPKVKIFIKNNKTFFKDVNPVGEDLTLSEAPIPNSIHISTIRSGDIS
jgi:hypothetical protein